jgi:hypothetical protein
VMSRAEQCGLLHADHHEQSESAQACEQRCARDNVIVKKKSPAKPGLFNA